MNARINLLKHQASVWCDQNIPDQYSEETNGYGQAWEDKFAELIVKECQHRVEQYINDCGEIASMPESVIMKHFGVEE